MLKQAEIRRLSGGPRLKTWGLALLSGPLLAVSQPPASVPWVGFIALVPLFVALPRLSSGGAWLASLVVGLVYFGADMWWLGRMTTDPGGEKYIFLMYVFVTAVMAAFYGFAGMTIRWLMTRQRRWPIWLVPLVWLGFEFAHEFDTPAPYPWLSVAYSLTDFALFIQTADIWGAYGVTACVVLVNLALAAPLELNLQATKLRLRRKGAYRFACPVVAGVMVLACCGYGWARLDQIGKLERRDGPLIGCVQGNLAQEVKIDPNSDRLPESFREHVELTGRACEQGAELVCWAETMVIGGSTREGLWRRDPADSARYFKGGVPDRILLEKQLKKVRGKRRPPTYIERLRALIAYQFETPMLVGTMTPVPDKERFHEWKDYTDRRYNTALLFDGRGRYVNSYDKRYLVPGGEYVPHEDKKLIRSVIERYATELQGFASYVEPGVRRTLFRLPCKAERLGGRNWAFTTSICYEYAWPVCYVELHENPEIYPDFHVNISNEGWFKRSAELDQAVNFCRFRCIESRMPMVRATNTGITCTIDACGRVRDKLTAAGDDREVQGLLITRPPVLAQPASTLFVSKVRRIPGFISLGVTAALLLMMTVGRFQDYRYRRRVKRNERMLRKALRG